MLIGEVSQQTGISARMLRHYDEIGLVSPTERTAGGYREYSPADLRLLFQVESLRSLGLSLREIRSAIDDPDFRPSAVVADLITATRQRMLREEELLRRLRQVELSDPAEWTSVLDVVALIRGLSSDDPSRRQQSALTVTPEGGASAAVLAEALLAETVPDVAGALRWALKRSSGDALDVLAPALDYPTPNCADGPWRRSPTSRRMPPPRCWQPPSATPTPRSVTEPPSSWARGATAARSRD